MLHSVSEEEASSRPLVLTMPDGTSLSDHRRTVPWVTECERGPEFSPALATHCGRRGKCWSVESSGAGRFFVCPGMPMPHVTPRER